MPAENSPILRLQLESGVGGGHQYQLTGPTQAGRDPSCGLVLTDGKASRIHVTFSVQAGSFWIADAGSTNGTLVNGSRLQVPHQLKSGDVITIGDTNIRVLGAGPTSVQDSAPVGPLARQPSAAPPPTAPPSPQATFQPTISPIKTAVPPVTSPPARSRRWAGVVLGCLGVGVVLLGGAAGGWWWWTHRGNTTMAETPAPPAIWDQLPEDTPPTPGQVAELNQGVAQVEAAFRSGDVARAMELVHPSVRTNYAEIFKSQPERLQRTASVLATRKLVALSGDVAEFEITNEGRTYPVTFERVGGKWLLSGL